ncbi:Ribulose-phosphate 3-epimerase [subsurface metagenome]
MIENVDRYISVFDFAGAVLCIHPEVSYHPIRTLQLIRDKGARPGIALDPALPVDRIKPMLPYVELICVMTVNPGYTGQKLIPATLDKITGLRRLIDREKLSIELEVDGNVSWENIPRMVKAGAEVLVAGTSSIFDTSGSRRDNIQRLQGLMSALVRET